MQQAIKVWVEKITGNSLPSLSIIKEPSFVKTFLMMLEPNYFKKEQLDSLDSIFQLVRTYFQKEFRLNINAQISVIKEQKDTLNFWELFLAIAIKCKKRDTNIQHILSMTQKYQQSLMVFIRRIDQNFGQSTQKYQSIIQEKKNEALEKVLLDTIQELTQQNNSLKQRIEDLQEQIQNVKIESKSQKKFLLQQNQNLQNERLEVLKEYQSVYSNHSLIAIFKQLQNENYQYSKAIQKKNQVLKEYQRGMEQINKQNMILWQQNRLMKKQYNKIDLYQKEIKQSKALIEQLQSNQLRYLQQIYQMQQKKLNLERLSLGREIVVQKPEVILQHRQQQKVVKRVEECQSNQVKRENQVKPSKKKSLETELKPIIHKQENFKKNEQLEKVIKDCNLQLQNKIQQIDKLNYITSTNHQKIHDFEMKITHLERLNQLHTSNIKQKQHNELLKQEQYQHKFDSLVKSIQELKQFQVQKDQDFEQLQKQAQHKTSDLYKEYSKKIQLIIEILQEQLVIFKDKQVNYLEKIKALNRKIQRLSKVEEIERVSSETIFKIEVSKQQSVILENTVKQNLERKQVENRQKDKLIEQLTTREKTYLNQIQLANEHNRILEINFNQNKLKFLKHLEDNLQYLRNREKNNLKKEQILQNTIHTTSSQMQNLSQNICQYQILMDQIQSLRQKQLSYLKKIKQLQRQPTSELIENGLSLKEINSFQKKKILSYFQNQLKNNQMIINSGGIIQRKQQSSETAQDSVFDFCSIQKKIENYRQLFDQKELTINKLLDQNQALRRQKEEAITQLITYQNDNKVIKLQNTNYLCTIQDLKHKAYELQYRINSNQEDNYEYYSKVSKMIDEIQTFKQNELFHVQTIRILKEQVQTKSSQNQKLLNKIKSQQLFNFNSSNNDYIAALKSTNQKLIEQMKNQSKSFQLFRRKYVQIHEKYKNLKQEHQILLSVMADLRISVKNRSI